MPSFTTTTTITTATWSPYRNCWRSNNSVLDSNLGRDISYLQWGFNGFPQCIQANSRIVPRQGYDNLLQYPSKVSWFTWRYRAYLLKAFLNNPQVNKNEDHDEKLWSKTHLYPCKYKVWSTLDTISNRRSVFIKDHKTHIPWCETGRLQTFVLVRDCCIIHALRGTTPPLLNLIYMPSMNTLPLSVFSCVKTNITLLYVHATRDMDWRTVFLLHVTDFLKKPYPSNRLPLQL
jgi:hypothetical protein